MAFQEGFQPNGGFIPPQSAGGNDGGAGGGVMVVTFTSDNNFPPNYTADKTFDEITNAFNNNQMIIGIDSFTNSYSIFNYTGKQHNPDDTECHVFEIITMHREDNTTIVTSNTIMLSNDNVVTSAFAQIENNTFS